jgi:hypothetical protein
LPPSSRLLLCFALLLVCLAAVPSVEADRKYKLSEYDERDRRDTRDRYSKRDLDRDDRRAKNRGRHSDDEEDLKFAKRANRKNRGDASDSEEDRKPVRRADRGEGRKGRRYNDDEEKVTARKVRAKKWQESDEDDYTDEDDVSESCIRGNKCSPEDDVTDETDEDTDEDESDEIPVKKRVTYVKKFAHEKKKKRQDKEIGSILKIHRKSGVDVTRRRDDDDSSEEIFSPKRRRFLYDDDDE